MTLKLIRPHIKYKSQIEDVKKEIESINQSGNDGKWYFKISNFENFVEKKLKEDNSKYLPKGRIPSSTFWMINEHDYYIGRITIKHDINDSLKKFGGHIGYDIRPSERQKGYGSKMLTLGLIEAKNLKLKKVLITCDKNNQTSKKIIENAGGYDKQENIVNERSILRYWIDV